MHYLYSRNLFKKEMQSYLMELSAQFFAVIISVFSFRKKSVSFSGFLSMLFISSFFIWNKGIAPLVILFAMFASASLLTRYKKAYKNERTNRILKKQGPRDFIQALSNLGIAFFCFFLYQSTAEIAFLLAMLSSVASSNADSWASEIGVLSNRRPVMITTFKPCLPGISGGVTWLGTLAGMTGSIFIAGLSILLKGNMGIDLSNAYLFFLVAGGGVFGLFLDSFLGAFLQTVYLDDKNEETEDPSSKVRKSRGITGVNNDMVNFLSSFLVAFLVFVLFR